MSKNKETKYPDERKDVYKASEKEPFKATREKKYRVVFKHNRSFDLRVNQETIKFSPHGINPEFPEKYKNGIPEKIVNSKDFQSHKNYFVVTEV